ncbi:MAG: secretin N-terminal domain-containing protein [Pyrinomonadaceae bacterium]
MFDVKNRDPQSLVSVLSGLGSGSLGTAMTPNRDFKTLTVRDFPENLASIEEALKRLDTPQAADIGLEIRIHVFIASNIEGAVNSHPDAI